MMHVYRSWWTRGVVVGMVLACSAGGTVLGQSGDPGASGAPAASLEPGSSPAIEDDVCARFRQDVPLAGRSSSRGALHTTRLAVTQGEAAGEDPYACRLPAWDPSLAWPFAGAVGVENAFHWSEAAGETVEAQGEIVGVGWVPIRLSGADANSIRKANAFSTHGAANLAIKAGKYLLVQVETAEVPAIAATRNLSFHLGTDKDGDAGNNTPSSTEDPQTPFQDLQNIYTVSLAKGGAAPALYATDFAGRPNADGSLWYNDTTTPFAARITDAPAGVQFLLADKSVGDSFRPISYNDAAVTGGRSKPIALVGGSDTPIRRSFDQVVSPTGSDFAAIGTRMGLVPKGGIADALVGCMDVDVIHQPVTVDLFVGGITQLDHEMRSGTPMIWCSWPTFADRDAIEAWFGNADPDGDGVAGLRIRVYVRVDETPLQLQRSRAKIILRGGNFYFGTTVGLDKFGRYRITKIELGETGDPNVDRIFKHAADAFVQIMPPWNVARPEGLTAGDAACVSPDDKQALDGEEGH
jgi:hypothetical protein